MTQTKRINKDSLIAEKEAGEDTRISEDEYEDHLDYCAAVEAIDEALNKGGMKRTRDFAKELGFDS